MQNGTSGESSRNDANHEANNHALAECFPGGLVACARHGAAELGGITRAQRHACRALAAMRQWMPRETKLYLRLRGCNQIAAKIISLECRGKF
jgi:hypothetical protein